MQDHPDAIQPSSSHRNLACRAAAGLAVWGLLGGIGTAAGSLGPGGGPSAEPWIELREVDQVAVAEPVAAAPARSDDLRAAFDAHVRALVEAEDFSGSVLVARGDELILSAGYGLANREHGVPCTPTTKYRIGSITKQFAAAAILVLQDRGLLDVRDELELYLPDLPEAWHPITIHQLLTHQSGLPNVTNAPDYMIWARLAARPLKTIERVFDRPLDFEPGTRYSYSNTGYLTLALVVEEASGESWETFLREGVLDPLGLDDTGHDRNDTILPERASGYQQFLGKLYNAPFHDMDVPIGGGDMYSTVEDLWAWDRALHDLELRDVDGAGPLLSAAAHEKMVTPNRSSYGYGVVASKVLDRPAVHHGGAIFGFRGHLARLVDERLTVVVLSNTGWSDPQKLALDLAELAVGAEPSAPEAVEAGSSPVKNAAESASGR